MADLIEKHQLAAKLFEFTSLQHLADEQVERHSPVFRGQNKVLVALSEGDNISQKENKLVSAKAKLDGLNPLNVLGRGYAIAEKDEKIITSAKQLSGGDEFTVILSDGKINAKVCGD